MTLVPCPVVLSLASVRVWAEGHNVQTVNPSWLFVLTFMFSNKRDFRNACVSHALRLLEHLGKKMCKLCRNKGIALHLSVTHEY